MTRQLISIILLATLFSFAPPAQLAEPAAVNIRLIVSSDNRSVSSIATSLRESLDARGIATSVHSVDEIEQLTSDTDDLFVSVGNLGGRRLHELRPDSQRLSIGTRRYGESPGHAHLNIEQPLCRQLALINAISDDIRRTSIISSRIDDDAGTSVAVRACAKRLGIALDVIVKREEESVNSVLRRALDTDALLALPDPVIYNRANIRNVLLLSYRKRIPVIGFSDAFVSAGALAAIHSTPDTIAEQAAEIIERRIQTGRFGNSLYQPEAYQISTNRFVSKSLGIELPDESILRQDIDRELRDE